MQVFIAFFIFVGFLSTFYPEQDIPDNEVTLPPLSDEISEMRMRVESLGQKKDLHVIKQLHDKSCGSATLSTLLNFYLGENFTENSVINALMKYGNYERIKEDQAFSLLDFKKFVNLLGYKGVGYKATLSDLKGLKAPGIIRISVDQFQHFVTLKGFYKNHVFVADPSRGITSYTEEEFLQIWDNILFMVYPEGAKELNYLSLRLKDLRIIDEDMALMFINDFKTPGIAAPDRLSGGILNHTHTLRRPARLSEQ